MIEFSWPLFPVRRDLPDTLRCDTQRFTLTFPLRLPALHREFARIASSGDPLKDAVSFAKRRGVLGVGHFGPGDTEYSEPLSRWIWEAKQLGALIRIWDALRVEDLELARRLVRWDTHDEVVRVDAFSEMGFRGIVADLRNANGRARIGPRKVQTRAEHIGDALAHQYRADETIPKSEAEWLKTVTSRTHKAYSALKMREAQESAPVPVEINVMDGTAHLIERWRESDEKTRLIEPLRVVLARRVNDALLGKVRYLVDPYTPAGFSLRPSSLLAAIWLVFAAEMGSRDAAERTCARTRPTPGCGNVFSPTKPWQQYCSERCRQLSHYHQKKEGTAHAK